MMITQNVTTRNAWEGKYINGTKIFNPGLALISLSGAGAGSVPNGDHFHPPHHALHNSLPYRAVPA